MRRVLLTSALALMVTGPAAAEPPRDWFVDMKKSAKVVRIAAGVGSSGALSEETQAIYKLTRRIDAWSPKPEAASVMCESATHALYKAAAAARDASQAEYQEHMRRYGVHEQRCYDALFTR